MHQTADALYPDWRKCLADTGWRLPDQMRKTLKYKEAFEARSLELTSGMVDWLGAAKTSEIIAMLASQLDAVVRFTAFVVAEFLGA